MWPSRCRSARPALDLSGVCSWSCGPPLRRTTAKEPPGRYRSGPVTPTGLRRCTTFCPTPWRAQSTQRQRAAGCPCGARRRRGSQGAKAHQQFSNVLRASFRRPDGRAAIATASASSSPTTGKPANRDHRSSSVCPNFNEKAYSWKATVIAASRPDLCGLAAAAEKSQPRPAASAAIATTESFSRDKSESAVAACEWFIAKGATASTTAKGSIRGKDGPTRVLSSTLPRSMP